MSTHGTAQQRLIPVKRPARLTWSKGSRSAHGKLVNGMFTNNPFTSFPWASLPPFDQVKWAGLFIGMGLCWAMRRVDVS